MTVDLKNLLKVGFLIRAKGDHELLLRLDRLMDIPDADERLRLLAQLTQELKSRKV